MRRIYEDKKGFLKVLEAVIAIVIIASVVLIIVVRNQNNNSENEQIKETQSTILHGIGTDAELRQAVLDKNEEMIRNYISSKLPSEYGFEINICPIDEVCGLPGIREDYTQGNIYSDQITVAATNQEYGPKILSLFVWEN